jgi:abortive infection bacteriophage resistance protein
MKRATTVEEQISILKSRGMELDIEEDKIKEVLQDIGYFRLCFYCFPFEKTYPNIKNRTHEYIKGSKLSNVLDLYYFDNDLRNILLKYINRIEINFRTKIIYLVSNHYPNCNTWFVDPAVINKSFIDTFDKELYTDKFKRNPIIKRHHANYINDKYAPAWKTLEFFTFGTIVLIYKNLKSKSLKRQISLMYNIKNEKVLENYFNNIVEIRNICAHGKVLFDHSLAHSITHKLYLDIDNGRQNNISSIIKVILYILATISQNRADDMKRDIETLFSTVSENDIISCLLKKCIGFMKF